MCYHTNVSPKKLELEQRFLPDLLDLPDWEPVFHASAFSLPQLPVLWKKDGQTRLEKFHWGLIPFWAKDEKTAAEMRLKTFNARSETIAEKPSFRSSIRSKRCLVPFSGFYEWHSKGSKKFPYFIHLKEEKIGAFAGIYDDWTNQSTGEVFQTFSIVTTAANPLMEHIHNSKKRMPVILDKTVEKLWIEEDLPLSQVLELTTSFPEEGMDAWTISKRITSRTEPSNVPAIIQKVEYPDLSEQGSLF